MRKEMVLGFLFDDTLSKVVLIRKNRPEWQAGKWNGVGGKIEQQDRFPSCAMEREFWEETGVRIASSAWKPFLTYEFPEALLYCYTDKSKLANEVTSETDERVDPTSVHAIPFLHEQGALIDNLSWLIPLALYHLKGKAWPGETFSYGKRD